MVKLAQDVETEPHPDEDDPELERQRNIERIKKKMRNVKTLFAEGHIEVDEFRQRMADNERELDHWQAFSTGREQAMLELTQCLDTIEKIARLWDIAEPKERQLMARNLFDYIVYDLDKQRIVDFKLKSWAERFIHVRGALYVTEDDPQEGENEKSSHSSSIDHVPHTGFCGRCVDTPLTLAA